MAQYFMSILLQATFLLLLILSNLPGTVPARHVALPFSSHVEHQHLHGETMQPRARSAIMKEPNGRQKSTMQENKVETFQVAGSRLPVCLYACGSCSPCRLVMVRSTCSQLSEAESCLMAYKCACSTKTYPVP